MFFDTLHSFSVYWTSVESNHGRKDFNPPLYLLSYQPPKRIVIVSVICSVARTRTWTSPKSCSISTLTLTTLSWAEAQLGDFQSAFYDGPRLRDRRIDMRLRRISLSWLLEELPLLGLVIPQPVGYVSIQPSHLIRFDNSLYKVICY